MLCSKLPVFVQRTTSLTLTVVSLGTKAKSTAETSAVAACTALGRTTAAAKARTAIAARRLVDVAFMGRTAFYVKRGQLCPDDTTLAETGERRIGC
jgi:hypothetical protein